jgi:hypothetical protein
MPTECNPSLFVPPLLEEVWFAVDSPLEGDGFEPSVPLRTHRPLVAEGNAVAIERGSLVSVVFLMRARGFESLTSASVSV